MSSTQHLVDYRSVCPNDCATCIDTSEASVLVCTAGQAPTKQVDVNDEIVDKYNLWMCIRACLFLMSWLMVAEKSEAYSEIFLVHMHQRFDGQPAPLSHFVTAFAISADLG